MKPGTALVAASGASDQLLGGVPAVAVHDPELEVEPLVANRREPLDDVRDVLDLSR